MVSYEDEFKPGEQYELKKPAGSKLFVSFTGSSIVSVGLSARVPLSGPAVDADPTMFIKMPSTF
jgi:hypothetical protein